MVFEHWLIDNSTINDIMDYYCFLRKRGYGREQACDQVYAQFQEEADDMDDGPMVDIAVALALCGKDELTLQARNAALQAIRELKQRVPDHDYDKITQFISEKHIGPEATYRTRKQYDPGWEIGDTFIHTLSQPSAERMGLVGWHVLFRKVGEYLDQDSRHGQLVYVTVCQPGRVPKTDDELKALGYLRMMEHDQKSDYLVQLFFKNRKDEEQWQLKKIGCFPNAGCPDDATEENPLVCMPFFGAHHRNSNMLAYEDQVCQMIRLHGIHKNS